jgi:hypothetical protein
MSKMSGLDRGYQTQPYRGGGEVHRGEVNQYDEPCAAVEEPLTSQISNRLDHALKDTEQLIASVAMRADSLFGPEPKNTLSNEKVPPPSLDRGVMDRISRQSRELLYSLETLEYQFRRFNQL